MNLQLIGRNYSNNKCPRAYNTIKAFKLLFVFLFLRFSRKQNTKIIYTKFQHNNGIKI